MKSITTIIILLLVTQISYSQRKEYNQERKTDTQFIVQIKTTDSLEMINKRAVLNKNSFNDKSSFSQSQKRDKSKKKRIDSLLKNTTRIDNNPLLSINPIGKKKNKK